MSCKYFSAAISWLGSSKAAHVSRVPRQDEPRAHNKLPHGACRMISPTKVPTANLPTAGMSFDQATFPQPSRDELRLQRLLRWRHLRHELVKGCCYRRLACCFHCARLSLSLSLSLSPSARPPLCASFPAFVQPSLHASPSRSLSLSLSPSLPLPPSPICIQVYR